MRKILREDAKTTERLALREYDGDVVRQAVTAPNGKEIFSLAQVIDQLTRANIAWTGVAGNPAPKAGPGLITFGFFETALQVYSSEQSQFQPLSEAQRTAVRNAFALYGDLLNVAFVEGTPGSADINIGNLNTSEDFFSAYASYPGFSLKAGDIWISTLATSNQEVGLGQAGFRTLMHEIGHALGMSHPGNYNAEEGVTLPGAPRVIVSRVHDRAPRS